MRGLVWKQSAWSACLLAGSCVAAAPSSPAYEADSPPPSRRCVEPDADVAMLWRHLQSENLWERYEAAGILDGRMRIGTTVEEALGLFPDGFFKKHARYDDGSAYHHGKIGDGPSGDCSVIIRTSPEGKVERHSCGHGDR